MKVDETVRELLDGGVATVVATRDDKLRPSITRGWGVAVSGDGMEVTLCVGAPVGSRVRANLESNGAIAVTCSRPTTYRTVQVKGKVIAVRDPSVEELAAVAKHVEDFSRDAEQVGLPLGTGPRLVDPELVAVSFTVSELYDQTPGPRAGARM